MKQKVEAEVIELSARGIDTLLMKRAVKVAVERGARMLVLETQTNNSGAIDFYLGYGARFQAIP